MNTKIRSITILIRRLGLFGVVPLIALHSFTVATSYGTEVGYWSFNEGSGTSIGDGSAHGNVGRLVNQNATTWVAGQSGSALNFDGTTGEYCTRVEIEDSASLKLTNAGSFAAWVRPYNIMGDEPIFAKEGDGLLSYWFGIYGLTGAGHWGNLLDHDGNQPWDFNGRNQGSITAGEWIHLATTWDGTTIKYYVNGSLTHTASWTNTINQSIGRLFIGSNSEYTSESNATAFRGAIDEVHIYDNAISDAQVAALAAPPAQPPQVEILPAVQLRWQSSLGVSYQIQWSPTLEAASWQNLGSPITGDGTVISRFDETITQKRKFYRVILL